MAQDLDSDKRPDGNIGLRPSANGNEVKTATSSRLVQTSDKAKDEVYSCFSSREKWGIISLISLASIFSSVPISK